MRDPYRPSAAVCLDLFCLAQGKVILAGSIFRREKMRWDLCTGTSVRKSLIKMRGPSHEEIWL